MLLPKNQFRWLTVILPAMMFFSVPAVADSLGDQIVGTWKLISWTRLVEGTEEPGPLGPDAIGFIMYTADGYMCGNGMRTNRAKFATSDFRAAPTEEKAAAFESYFGYCGRYQVNDSEGFVTHNVEVSSFPNFTGTAQKRFVTVSGDRMKITTAPFSLGAKQVVSVLLCERAK
jgi:hypothetical protein